MHRSFNLIWESEINYAHHNSAKKNVRGSLANVCACSEAADRSAGGETGSRDETENRIHADHAFRVTMPGSISGRASAAFCGGIYSLSGLQGELSCFSD
jgi:hypothetical protein